MANEEHLKILKKGVEVWNKWRKENLGVIPDLSAADLSGVYLSGADLSEAHLLRAKLRKANLSKARLSWANLSFADLHGADLLKANLVATALNQTVVAEANIESAELGNTLFLNVDLSLAAGLGKCIHIGPSIIDHRTLEKSGDLPVEFLRGCGLPDYIIDAVNTQRGKGTEFYSCFISHSSRNQDFADRLYADLQNEGVRCWLATEDLKIGDSFRDKIDQAIRLRDKLLLILSEDAIASKWVGHEVEAGLEEEENKDRQVMFPVRIDDAVMNSDKAWAAMLRRERHIGDFTNWKDPDEYQKAFDRLLRDLAAG